MDKMSKKIDNMTSTMDSITAQTFKVVGEIFDMHTVAIAALQKRVKALEDAPEDKA